MDRRDILKLGAAGALAGCAPRSRISFRVPPPPQMSAADVERTLTELDATLAKMAASRPSLARLTPARAGEAVRTLDDEDAARGHDLTVRTLAAMHVAATFNELPESARRRDDVQRRMVRALPLIDGAMLDMADYVGSLGPLQRRALQAALRKEPSLGMDAIGALDEHAASVGIPPRRRAQMRAIAAHASWRMTRQSVDTMLGETLEKVRRTQERHVVDERVARALAEKMTEVELFDRREGRAHVLFATGVPGHRSHRGDSVLLAGGILLGIGAAAGITGAVLVGTLDSSDGAWLGGAILITVGAGLGLAGIICLIVGAVLHATDHSNDDPDDD